MGFLDTGANSRDFGKVVLGEDIFLGYYIDDLRADIRRCLRVRGKYAAAQIVKPGRLLVLVDGQVQNGPPSLGPVIGVCLARSSSGGAYDPGEVQLALRGGTVVVDGAIGADQDPVYVDASGAFVLAGAQGAELLANACSCGDNGAVALNIGA